MSNYPLAKRMRSMERSTIREILKITKNPEIISFAGGLPAPELFPIKEFAAAMSETLATDGKAALQYDVTEGFSLLRNYMSGWLSRQGLPCTPENVMFTSGSQQALDLAGRIFIDPRDKILVENPTYLGAIQAFNAYQPRYVSVPMDNEGLLPEALHSALEKHTVKFIYVVPTFQNPSGITMSVSRRKVLIEEARSRNILIIEDDPYGLLRFSGNRCPSLYELASGKGVIYMSTFSKILSPGIRLGYVASEPSLLEAFITAKQAADLQPNSLIQRAVYHYAKNGHLDAHIPVIINAYRSRAQTMLSAMKEYFPPTVTWVEPEGGMFIWVCLPKKMSAEALFARAVENKVAFVTGTVFHPNGGGDNTLRLNFTNSTPAQIQQGIRQLGSAMHSMLTSKSSSPRSATTSV